VRAGDVHNKTAHAIPAAAMKTPPNPSRGAASGDEAASTVSSTRAPACPRATHPAANTAATDAAATAMSV
jgi:hypothetical protein